LQEISSTSDQLNLSDKELINSIENDLRSIGYSHLPSHLPGNSTEDTVRSIGTAVSLGNSGSPIHQLTPKSTKASTPNTYSGIYGYNQFPLHTDLAHWRFPPRFLLLRCIKGFEAVPTLLVDGLQAIDDVRPSIFSRALVRPRRPINGSFPLLRLYDQQHGDRGLLRWDEVFICPASAAGETGVTKLAECIARSEPIRVSLANQGDTLIIDNWRMLHGRSPIPPACRGRVLERAYLEKLH
jgi:L-asparagine oxygenase